MTEINLIKQSPRTEPKANANPMQAEMEALKKEMSELRNNLNKFKLHIHNGSDSTRIDFEDIVGEYILYKNGRPIQ